jgi:hypothetical protein
MTLSNAQPRRVTRGLAELPGGPCPPVNAIPPNNPPPQPDSSSNWHKLKGKISRLRMHAVARSDEDHPRPIHARRACSPRESRAAASDPDRAEATAEGSLAVREQRTHPNLRPCAKGISRMAAGRVKGSRNRLAEALSPIAFRHGARVAALEELVREQSSELCRVIALWRGAR